jgi:predicted HicB family RNase H-like nuclease
MEYKGYTATVEFDDAEGVFHGTVQDLRDVVTFEGTSVEQLRQEFRNSVDDYLEFCARRGKEPDRPYSGKVLLRLTPDLHRAAAVAAAREGASLNAWVAGLVEAGATVRADHAPRSRVRRSRAAAPGKSDVATGQPA